MLFSTGDVGWTCRAKTATDSSGPAPFRQQVIRDAQCDPRAFLVSHTKAEQIEWAALRIPQHLRFISDSKEHGPQSLVEIPADRVDARANDKRFVITEQISSRLRAVELVVPVISPEQRRQSFAPGRRNLAAAREQAVHSDSQREQQPHV